MVVHIPNLKRIKPFEDILLPILFVTFILSKTVLCANMDGETTPFGMLLKLVRYSIYGLSVLKLLFDDFKIKSLKRIIPDVCIVLISFLGSHNTEIVCFFIVALAIRNIPYATVMRIFVRWCSLVLVVIVVLALAGVLPDYVEETTDRTRHFLGFDWTTTAPILFMFYSMAYLALKEKKVKLVEIVLISAVALFFFKITDSRFAFLLTVASALFMWLYDKRWFSRLVRVFEPLLKFAPWALFFLAIFISKKYDAKIALWKKLNSLLSNRLYLTKDAMEQYDVPLLFGQQITWKGFNFNNIGRTDYNFVDCAYIKYLLEFGALFWLMVLILFSVGIARAAKRKSKIAWALFFVCCFGMMEYWMISPSGNPFNWCIVYFFTDSCYNNIESKISGIYTRGRESFRRKNEKT